MITNHAMMVVLMFVMCGAVRAQSTASTNAEQSPSGVITGRVVNENGQALPGASLNVRAVSSTNPGRTLITDLEGNFRASNLDPGLYMISAGAPAYTSEPNPGEYYRVGDSVRLQLIKGGVVTGTVTNAMGEPIVGVNVRAIRIRDAQGQLPKSPSFANSQQSTDDRGMYRIYGLAPGTYVVGAGGGSGFIGFFSPFDSDIPTFSPSATRDTAAEIVVRAGEESTADIRYRGEPGYSISGKVNVSGNDRATITLTTMGVVTSTSNAFVVPGSTGFMFNGLPDGEYKLVASVISSTPTTNLPQSSLSDPKRVTIKRASVTGIELTPKPLGSISGRFSLEPTKVTECQGKRPPLFAETMVQAHRSEKDIEEDDLSQRTLSSTAIADGNGAFTLRNLRAGRYRFEPRFYARYWYLQSITMTTGAVKPQKIDVAANWTTLKSSEQLHNVTITLAEGAASLRGRIVVAEGATAPATAVVYLVPTETDKADDVLRYFVTNIGADGAFTLTNLPPGKYLALMQTTADAQIETLAKLRQPESAAARTKLRRNAEAQKAEIELKPCQNLTDYQLVSK